MNFFKDMYTPISIADIEDSGYMMCALILSVIVDITMLVICAIVLIQPSDLRGGLLEWSQGEYRFIAWIIIASIGVGWALFASYMTVVKNRHSYPQSNKSIQICDITSNVLYYMHHLLTGSLLIMFPIVIVCTIGYYIGKLIAIGTMFIMNIPLYISNKKHQHYMLNTELRDDVEHTFNEFNSFLR